MISLRETRNILDSLQQDLSDKESKITYPISYFRYSEIIKVISWYPKYFRILEVGSGSCILSAAIAKLGYNYYCIDLDSANFLKWDKKYNLKFKQCYPEIESIPYDENFFDIVIFSEVLEHLSRHPYKILSNIRKVLKKDGLLLLTTPNVSYILNRIRLLCGMNVFPEIEEFYCEPLLYGDLPIFSRHHRFFTMQEVIKVLRESNFIIVSKRYCDFYEKVFKVPNKNIYTYKMQERIFDLQIFKKLFIITLTKFIPSFRSGIMVIAKK